MKILVRAFSAAVFALLIGAAGVVFSVQSQKTTIQSQLQTVADTYAEVMLPVLAQVSQMNLRPEEINMVNRARTQLAAALPGELAENVEHVAGVRQTLHALTASLATHEELSQHPVMEVLKKETTAQGKTAEALQVFNASVLAWNQRDRSTFGQWISSLMNLEKIMMINSDGRTEVMPSVTL